MMCKTLLSIVASLSLAGAGSAAVITPNVDAPFSGGFSSLSREAPRVLQNFIDSSFLGDVTTPTTVYGLSFRLPGSANASYPAGVDLVFSRYDVTLAKASAAAAAANALTSTTFADNMTDPVLVRSGALTIPADSLTDADSGPGPAGSAEFSFVIDFTTPYTIQPGDDLVVLVRHSGHGNATVIRYNFDSYAYAGGVAVSTAADPDAAAANFALSAFSAVNKYALVVPEPAALSLLALAGLALRRR